MRKPGHLHRGFPYCFLANPNDTASNDCWLTYLSYGPNPVDQILDNETVARGFIAAVEARVR